MKTLAVYDKKDYAIYFPRIVRSAARAIIIKNNKVALLNHQKDGMYLFPGGGIGDGETNIEALIREVREEMGLIVKPRSISEFGLIIDIKKDIHKADTIYEMRDYYYFCDVEDIVVETSLEDEEAEKGYKLEYVSFSKAISTNYTHKQKGFSYWAESATHLLELLRDTYTV